MERRHLLSAAGFEWVDQFGGDALPAAEHRPTAAAAADGSFYVAGHTDQVLPGQSGNGSIDAYLRKYDALGNELWTRQFGTTRADRATAVAADSSGVYVAGTTTGSLGGKNRNNQSDVFVRKYDAGGNVVWTTQFGITSSENVRSIALHGSSLYVFGEGLDLGLSLPGNNVSGSGTLFLRKMTLDGEDLWTRRFVSAGGSQAWALAADSTGIYVGYTDSDLSSTRISKYDANGTQVWDRGIATGATIGGISLSGSAIYVGGKISSALHGQTHFGGSDAFLRKYSLGGGLIWSRQFGTDLADSVRDVSADASGVYFVGRTETVRGANEVGLAGDSIVGRYDGDGNLVWRRDLVQVGDDSPEALAVDGTGLYVVGNVAGSHVTKLDFQGNAAWTSLIQGTAYPADETVSAADADGNLFVVGHTTGELPRQWAGLRYDMFLRMYDRQGNEVWTRQFGGEGNDYARAVSVSAGGIYVLGDTADEMPGHVSAGSQDVVLYKFDDQGKLHWTRQFGTAAADFGYGVETDAESVYIVGETAGALPSQPRDSGTDAFVRRYDHAGNEIWTRQFGRGYDDSARGVTLLDGAVVVGGFTAGELPNQRQVGGVDAFVRAYDPNGNLLWTRQAGTAGDDRVLALSSDAASIYAIGSTSGQWEGQVTSGGEDAFLWKLDGQGADIWTRQFGTAANDVAAGVYHSDGAVYVVGTVGGALPGQPALGSTDAFARKFDDLGSQLWTRQFGTAASDTGSGVSADESGLYVVGSTAGEPPADSAAPHADGLLRKLSLDGDDLWTRSIDGQPYTRSTEGVTALVTVATDVYAFGFTSGILRGQEKTQRDLFARKYSSDGRVLWTRQYGNSLTDRINDAISDGSYLYTVGWTYGPRSDEDEGNQNAVLTKLDMDGNVVWQDAFGEAATDEVLSGVAYDASGIYVVGNTEGTLEGQTSAGQQDIFVRKYGFGGNVIWTRQFGKSASDEANAIVATAGGVYIGGRLDGKWPGTTSTSADAFVRKYDTEGNEAWTRQFHVAAFDAVDALADDGSGVYLVGHVEGALPGQQARGETDAFIRKYDHSGQELWTRQFGGLRHEDIVDAAIKGDTLYISGKGSLSINAGGEPFVIAYTPDGDQRWVGTFASLRATTMQLAISGEGVFLGGGIAHWLTGLTMGAGPDAFVGELVVPYTLQPIGNRSVDAGESLEFTARLGEGFSGTVTYSLDGASLAKGMAIDARTGAFSWTPGLDRVGSHVATVFVTQAGATAPSSGETFTVSVVGLDYGDAPASYGTLLADNGARHAQVDGGPWLGGLVDADLNGAAGAAATGDDTAGSDDEDGIRFLTPLVPGETAQIEVALSRAGRLSGWIDFDADGQWTGTDKVLGDVMLSAGTHTVSFAVPATAQAALVAGSGRSYARFRVSNEANLGPTGRAADGEVEDYQVVVQPPVFIGTGGADTFYFETDGVTHRVKGPGFDRSFDAMRVSTVRFDAQAGDDRLYVASRGVRNETLESRVEGITLTGPSGSYRMVASGFETSYVNPGEGSDTAKLFDGPAADQVTLAAGYFDMKYGAGAGRVVSTSPFDSVTATATAQGSDGVDTAIFLDSAGDDVFAGARSMSTMRPAAGNAARFDNRAVLFERVFGYSSSGNDAATLADNLGQDNLLLHAPAGNTAATAGSAEMIYHRDMARIKLQATVPGGFFDRLTATSTDAYVDLVHYNGSPGDDVYTASARQSQLTGPGYQYTANGFGYAYVTASGGHDTAAITGSPGADRYYATAAGAALRYASGDLQSLAGFEAVTVEGNGGSDTAMLYDTPESDRFTSTAQGSRLERLSGGYRHAVDHFASVYAYALAGGDDEAVLTGSPLDDKVVGQGKTKDIYIRYGGPAESLSFARGFDQAIVDLSSGGDDTVVMIDSAADDTFTGEGSWAQLSDGLSYLHRIEGLGSGDRVYLSKQHAGTDRDLHAAQIDYYFSRSGQWV